MVISFNVYGKPQPRGSKRAFPRKRKDGSIGVAVSDDNPKSRDWMACVIDAAQQTVNGQLLSGPLAIVFTFVLPRPKSHFGTGRNASLLKDSAPRWPAVKPDLLKLARAAEDALTGVVYLDDAQIVRELLCKVYGPQPSMEVFIEQL